MDYKRIKLLVPAKPKTAGKEKEWGDGLNEKVLLNTAYKHMCIGKIHVCRIQVKFVVLPFFVVFMLPFVVTFHLHCLKQIKSELVSELFNILT